MWNIFKKKKVVEEQPKEEQPEIGSYRIAEKGGKYYVQRYVIVTIDLTFGTRCNWQLLKHDTFNSIDEAKQFIKEYDARLNAPVTYTEVNLDEL